MDKDIFFQALEIFASKINHSDVIWGITGSMSLMLQGVAIEPLDIDILTNTDGAISIENCLQQYVIKPVSHIQSQTIRSYYGVLQIGGISFDLIGDIENLIGGVGWDPHTDWVDNIIYVNINCLNLPVLALEYEYSIYKKLGNAGRTKMLEGYFQSTRQGAELL